METAEAYNSFTDETPKTSSASGFLLQNAMISSLEMSLSPSSSMFSSALKTFSVLISIPRTFFIWEKNFSSSWLKVQHSDSAVNMTEWSRGARTMWSNMLRDGGVRTRQGQRQKR